MECSLQKREEEPWRVLEFYSGIGGMRYSLMKAGVNATLVEAFDINDTANDVYEHNFGHRPFQGNIQSLTAANLNCYGAHAWLLSPPCQPYTRQGLQKQSGDSRASSFLRILELIPVIMQRPLLLFVENVVGFEISDTREKMLEILAKVDFVTQEFILSPLQFGVPYSRPRYFCLAKRAPLSFQRCGSNAQLFWPPTPLFGNNDEIVNYKSIEAPEISDEMLQSCEPVARFMEHPSNHETCSLLDAIVSAEYTGLLEPDDVEKRGDSSCQYFVPTSLIERWGSAMDIVYPDSKRCCCFTKSYYRYVKGTGSLLAIGQHETKDKLLSLKEQSLRYFTPREVANLHSFPKDFQFPPHVSLRQRNEQEHNDKPLGNHINYPKALAILDRPLENVETNWATFGLTKLLCALNYALLGNSLSISVVAPLLQYLFTE